MDQVHDTVLSVISYVHSIPFNQDQDFTVKPGKVYFLICKLGFGSSGGYGHLADHSTWRAKGTV